MIIKRYIRKELVTTFAAVFLVLMLVVAGQSFVRAMGAAAEGDMPADLVYKLLAIRISGTLGELLPLAWFMSLLLAFGRMNQDNEMTVIAATGVSFQRILRFIALPVLLFTLLVGAISFLVKPWSEEYNYRLRDEAKARNEITGVRAGGFNEINKGERVFYVEALSEDRLRMQNVFIQGSEGNGDKIDLFTAPSSRQDVDPQTGERFLVLENGYRYEIDRSKGDYKFYEYQEAAVRLEKPEVTPEDRGRRALSIAKLWASDNIADKAELQWRISLPLSVLLLTVLGMLLSQGSPREGRTAKVFVAIMIYVFYVNIMAVAKTWVALGKVNSVIGLWWVHGLVVLLIVWLYGRRYGFSVRPRRPEVGGA
ncbi:MAG: LPS export ABC transporter permease LptF [Pseudomonadota bacterium]